MEEKKKMGRPIVSNRNKDVHFRISEKELEDLQKCATALGVNRIEVIIKGIELVKKQLKIK